MFHIHSCIESTSTIFTFFPSFIYIPLPISALLLTWPVFHSCPSLFRCLSIVQWGFCFGILPVDVLCLSQSNPLHCNSSFFPPILCCSTVFRVSRCVLFLHRCGIFHYYSLSFF
jgi:hypothetical protein